MDGVSGAPLALGAATEAGASRRLGREESRLTGLTPVFSQM